MKSLAPVSATSLPSRTDEAAGLEVWRAPLLTDNVDFRLRKDIRSGITQ